MLNFNQFLEESATSIVSGSHEHAAKGEEYFVPLPYDTPFDLIKDVDKILHNYQFVSSFIDEYETESSPAILKLAYQSYSRK